MKVTLDLKGTKYKQFNKMDAGDIFVNPYTCQVMIYKGIHESTLDGEKFYEFLTLDDTGSGFVGYSVKSYGSEKLQVADLDIVIRS